MQNREKSDYDNVISSYFENEQVTALINLKVETKEADVIAENISKDPAVSDVYLVTGDTDIVAVVKFQNYSQLKRFLVEKITNIPGIRESKTSMVVTTFKEGNELIFESGEQIDKAKSKK